MTHFYYNTTYDLTVHIYLNLFTEAGRHMVDLNKMSTENFGYYSSSECDQQVRKLHKYGPNIHVLYVSWYQIYGDMFYLSKTKQNEYGPYY